MKLSRDESRNSLIKKLSKLGYEMNKKNGKALYLSLSS